MERARFEQLVAEAIEGLPEEFQDRLENIDVTVEEWPSQRQIRQAGLGKSMTLLGLYEGIPLTERNSGYGMVPPDKVTIFQKTIEAKCGSNETCLKEEIQQVVRHEIAHHFGIGDVRLSQIENQRRDGKEED
jgi:predicted Zn-dependent protease with MMP-like domain